MILSPASPAKNAKIPSPSTTTPADLKKSEACLPCAKDAEPKDNKASIGKVPRAKATMIRRPEKKDPLESAATCIDWVKPQGRKKVPKPTMRGVKVLCSIFLKKLKMPGCRVILLFAKTPIKFSPSNNITKEAISPRIAVKVKLMPIAPPSAPNSPPKRAKLTSRPAWKSIKVLVSLILSCEILAERESTSPPTIARQVETEAISPIKKLAIGVICPPMPIFKIPDFCNMKNSAKNKRPIGRACQITPFCAVVRSCLTTDLLTERV